MPPNSSNDVDSYLPEVENFDEEETIKLKAPQAGPRKYEIVYKNIFIIGYLHIAALYGIYLSFTTAKWQTVLFAYLTYVAATVGVTAGAHRLWSHTSFKAKMPLQIILMIFVSIANQRVSHWVRDHRLHHKYSDTDADPHNASRGFFYSHIGWLFVKKHPEVKKRGKVIDLTDIFRNPVLRFQHKYSKSFIPTMCFIIPTMIPIFCWGETIFNAWHLTIMRYVCNFHVFFLVNSAAHIWGTKPYDKNIMSTESKAVALATLGEGFHNFHHVFPWDYRSAELGNTFLNYTKTFIEIFAKIGWAYDLKTVPYEMVVARSQRTGDGTRHTHT